MIKQEWKKYKYKFFEKCCKLICEAKPKERPIYFDNKKYTKPEDHITNDYLEVIKKNDLKQEVRADGGKQKCGAKEYALQEPDITFSNLTNTLKTCFECKILGENSKYIDDGIQRFVIEKYGFVNMPFYGMLGYVKDGDSAVLRYKDNLEKSIDNKKNDLNLTSQEIIENSNLQVVFKTKHTITDQKRNPKIEITHILHCWA